MSVIVEEINAKVAVAREHAVRGELPSASQNFKEALYLVDRCAPAQPRPAGGVATLIRPS